MTSDIDDNLLRLLALGKREPIGPSDPWVGAGSTATRLLVLALTVKLFYLSMVSAIVRDKEINGLPKRVF
jgi:hypothetical protein